MGRKTSLKMYLLIVLTFLISMAGNTKADFTFGEPTNLGPRVNSSFGEDTPSLTADGLTLFFNSGRPAGFGDYDIWYTTRATTEDEWGQAHNIGSTINTSAIENSPNVSADGLTLYFGSDRPGGSGSNDIWFTTRVTINDPWTEPENLGPIVNSSAYDWAPSLSADGLSIYFTSSRPGGSGDWDIWVTTRATTNSSWTEPENLGPIVNSNDKDGAQSISADGSVLFFMSSRPGGHGSFDAWLTRRATTDDGWETPINLGSTINTSKGDGPGPISPDGSTFFFVSARPGGYGSNDLWRVSIEPVVDLNGDGFVDILDLRVMVDHWGENYSLCDIGPTLFGDGVVDIQDLSVLVEYLLEDYPLVAHWKLDETDGVIAYDSIGDHDGTLNGNPFWQPTGGTIDGALLVAGVDDYVDTPFILNTVEGSLSVFVWIYGGAPGQVIISQTGDFGGTWLGIDPSEGKLMTELSDMYFGALVSEIVVTDGQWHHVGLVYDLDSMHRRLYVDGAQVAEDATVVSGVPSDGGLHIGTSKDLDASSFFTGLIDDVRIYDTALTAEEIAALAQ